MIFARFSANSDSAFMVSNVCIYPSAFLSGNETISSHGARWIMIATLGGQMTEIDLKNIYVRNVRIIGSTLRSRPPQMKAQILAALVRDVWPKVAAGEIRPTIYAVLPITDAEKAQDMLYRSENVGKVVLTVE